MSDAATLTEQIAALDTAITTVAAGRSAQWGDQLVTLESLPNLINARAHLKRELAGLNRRSAGDRSSARYRTAAFPES